jgi:hypothetical protein
MENNPYPSCELKKIRILKIKLTGEPAKAGPTKKKIVAVISTSILILWSVTETAKCRLAPYCATDIPACEHQILSLHPYTPLMFT